MASLVKQDARGVWYSRPYLGRNAEGRAVRPMRTFPEARSREEAERMAREWLDRAASLRLTDLLADYIDTCEANGRSPNSVRQYRTFLNRYVSRFLAGRRADELRPRDVTEFEKALLRRGAADGGPLSPATVTGCLHFLRAAYNYMIRQGLVESNPAAGSERPSAHRDEAAALDERDLALLVRDLDRMLGDLPRAPSWATPQRVAREFGVWMALHTGMRAGEVAALRRRDVSARRGWAHVGGTVVESRGRVARKDRPKSSKSYRNVSMTADELDLVERFEVWQEARTGRGGGSEPLVSHDGLWTRPSLLARTFAKQRDRLGIDRGAHFHTLRHTHASWCLAQGVDLVTLSERLGHASPDITARVYGHMVEGRDSAAAAAFQDLLRSVGEVP